MPITAPDIVLTPQGTAVTFDVLANDSASNPVVESFTQPASGALVLNGDQTFTYTPAPDFAGVDQFSYTIRDADGTTDTGQVTLNVLAPNSSPEAGDDAARTTSAAVIIDVLANDSDPDGDELRIAAVGTPAYGTVTVNPDQSLSYRPQTGFWGTDRFSYTIIDGRGGSATATVTVQVERPNQPPVVTPATLSTTVDTPIDFDPSAVSSDPDGDPIRLQSFGLPAHGRLEFAGGTLTYMPDPGFSGEDSFTCTVEDGHGGTATGIVRITVDTPNTSPIARPDQATTSHGTPVEIPLLDNDEDPDGDPLSLTGLGIPANGQLALNPNGSVTYTPEPGYSGADSFTYTVADGRGGHAVGEVQITVAPPPPQLYPNGYRHRRRILIPAQQPAGTVSRFILRLRQEGPWLRSVANGGQVESPAGFDLRFEREDGTRLDHEIEHYDPTSGSLEAWVRLTNWDPGQPSALFLYYGKQGLEAPEEDPAAVWQDHLAVWDLSSGRDRSGSGRDLVVNGVAMDSGEKVALFDGNAEDRLSDASFLDGLNALHLRAMVRADAAIAGTRDAYILQQGQPTSSPGALGLSLFYDREGHFGGALRTIKFTLATTDGSVQFEASQAIQSTEWQVLDAVWESGKLPRLFVNGEEMPASWAGLSSDSGIRPGGTANAPLSPVAGQPLSIGIGSLNSARSWIGRMDELRLSGQLPEPVALAAEVRNMLDPAGFYGLGDEENVTDFAPSPVAAPLEATTRVGQWVDVDPLAVSFLPEGTGLTLGSQPQHGIANLVGNRIRYTPVAGFAGSDSFTYVLTNGDKTSSSRIRVTVTSENAGLAGEYPSALRFVNVASSAELAAALASAQPGDHIILADGTYGGQAFSTSVAGTAEHPIVLRAANKLAASLTSDLQIDHPWYLLWGIDFDGQNLSPGSAASDLVVRRCRSRNFGVYQGIWCRVKAPRVRFEKCDFSSPKSRGISLDLAAGGRELVISRCHFHDWGPSGTNDQTFEPIQLGFGHADADRDAATRIEYCLFENINPGNKEPECISIKSKNVTVFGCHFRNARLVKVRIGRQAHIEACRFERSGSAPSTGIDMTGIENRVLGCTVAGSVRLLAGTVDGDSNPSGWTNRDYPSAKRAKLVGVTADSFRIGHRFSSSWSFRATDNRLENCTGPVSRLFETGTVETSQESETYEPPVTLTPADVGPDAS